jgi:23S rRNA (adenine2503-C2)-methyltransferase
VNLLDLTPSEAEQVIQGWIADRGDPPYRVRQILPRLWQRPVSSWDDTTDLPRALIGALNEDFPLPRPQLATTQESADGTVKFLWKFDDETAVESVLIPEGRRRTLCISSQAGCAYGCLFCATGRMGFQRHLAAWEIVAQVRELGLDSGRGLPSHVVFMGMGEPLHNWEAVDRALTMLNDGAGLGIGARRITVSTIGIVPNMLKLAARPEQFRLALSLHSAIGDRRLQLMPVEQKYPLAKVLQELENFTRRVTFEYVMIDGVNDSGEDAKELARIACKVSALVNLLPLHPGGAPGMRATPIQRIAEFAEHLERLGAKVTVRRSRGLDISAACGQLRSDFAGGRNVETQQHADVE